MCRHCALSEPQLVRTTHRRPALRALLRFVEIRFCALVFLVAQAFVAHLVQLVRPETPIPQMADCESVAWQGRPHLKMQIGCQA